MIIIRFSNYFIYNFKCRYLLISFSYFIWAKYMTIIIVKYFIMPNKDPKSHIKEKIKDHYFTLINDYETNKNSNKVKSGRPNSLSISNCIDAILFVLIEGVSWTIASKLATNNYSYDKTINRRFNEWVKSGLFTESYKDLTNKYVNLNKIKELYIDSTDSINKNMPKKHTGKSYKLKKQALRTSIITDEHKIPLCYSVDEANLNDIVLGEKILNKLDNRIAKNKNVYADKGYYLKQSEKNKLLNEKKLRLVVPKKKKRQSKKNIKKNIKTNNKNGTDKKWRLSKIMKNGLTKRVLVEHANSILHRTFCRFDQVYDKNIAVFKVFLEMAISIQIINTFKNDDNNHH